MFLLLRRHLRLWWQRSPWLLLFILLLLAYTAGYVVLWQEEPTASAIRSLGTYSWFFMVTVTTVGYGDVVPVSGAGRAAASVIMVVGIAAHGLFLGKIVDFVINWRRRGVKGLLAHHLKDHIVIFGNRGAETASLIKKLAADSQTGAKDIVLCSLTTEENPFPDLIRFVHGDPTSADVMERACVGTASKIVIHSSTDAETAFIALAVRDVNRTAHIVLNVNDPGQEIHLQRIDKERIICIKPVNVPMMVREIHNPGITQVLENLLSPDGQDLRSLQIPRVALSLTFGILAHVFRERYGAILIGMRPSGNALNSGSILNPPFDTKLESGMFLDYISKSPLEIAWDEVAAEHRGSKI